MDPIQHGARGLRLIPEAGPALHLSMYRGFVGGDDARARCARKPGGVTERSEP
ncbi:hypothetical protein SUDANB130_02036 [Streptomyces sp. enrichment culture]